MYVCMYVCMACGTGGRGGWGGGKEDIFGQLFANARIAALSVRKGIAHFPDNMYVCMYMLMCLRMYCVNVFMYMYMFMYVCMYICMFMYVLRKYVCRS